LSIILKEKALLLPPSAQLPSQSFIQTFIGLNISNDALPLLEIVHRSGEEVIVVEYLIDELTVWDK